MEFTIKLRILFGNGFLWWERIGFFPLCRVLVYSLNGYGMLVVAFKVPNCPYYEKKNHYPPSDPQETLSKDSYRAP
jgi:hypothetical protein